MSESIGPGWKRIADDLKAKIESGELSVDAPIPTTTELINQYGVSKTVVRHAVDNLRGAGLVIGHGGKRVYVKAKPQDVAAERVTVENLREQIAELRDEIRDLVANADPGPAVENIAADVADIREIVNLLQVHLRTLYSRVAQPYPDAVETEPPPQQRHRKSS